MIVLAATSPAVDVLPAEYARLLGFPRDWVLEGRPRELAEQARAWYAQHGRPWVYSRHAESLEFENGSVLIDGERFNSRRLRAMLEQSQAHTVVLTAVSAGPELELEAQQRWRDEKPDEYFFLEVLGSAIVEHLTMAAGAELCAWADESQMAVLPHESPGYPEWDVAEQPRLLEVIRRSGDPSLPGDLQSLDSGMLRPKKSLLAVFGLTRALGPVRELRSLTPCENCALANCQYRRAAYVRPPLFSLNEAMLRTESAGPSPPVAAATPTIAPLVLDAQYGVNAKALARWSRDRLTLMHQGDGTIDARFRYEGTTCTNMGQPLQFDYSVTLGPRDQGYPIRNHDCTPAPGHDGYASMCRFIEEGPALLRTIAAEKPLAGRTLDEALQWQRPNCAAGCYCDAESRSHKWGLVLETIHYAIAQLEKADAVGRTKEETPR